MAITERQMMILKAIIDDYIATGIPVGSRTLSKREEMFISSRLESVRDPNGRI